MGERREVDDEDGSNAWLGGSQENNRTTTEKMANGIAVGLDKGHQVTKKERKAAPARRKGCLANRVKLVREIVKEVAGMAPYEKRIAELLRIGKDKRALKYAKNKLGTHIRAKRKRDEVAEILRKARSKVKSAFFICLPGRDGTLNRTPFFE